MKNRCFTALCALLSSRYVSAQELDVDISSDGISIDTRHWYENPLVWVGIILVVLLIVFLSRGARAKT